MISTAVPTTLLMIALAAAPAGDASTADYPTLWKQAAEAYEARNAKRSIELLGEIVDRTPGRAEAWIGLSRAYEWAGRLEDAIAVGERAQDLGWTIRDSVSTLYWQDSSPGDNRTDRSSVDYV